MVHMYERGDGIGRMVWSLHYLYSGQWLFLLAVKTIWVEMTVLSTMLGPSSKASEDLTWGCMYIYIRR
jgi:hypothetical protein